MSRAITLVGFIAVAVALVAYEMRSRGRGRATIADAFATVLRNRVGYFFVLAAWLWVGWHLFARTGEH